METGTLEELGVKPGDVVKKRGGIELFDVGYRGDFPDHPRHRLVDDNELTAFGRSGGFQPVLSSHLSDWMVISRASDTPKTWGEMTDAEKGALLLAWHEGRSVDYWSSADSAWCVLLAEDFEYGGAYRIRPESKREAVTLWWERGCVAGRQYYDEATHRITFDTIDGKPDLTSIKMEEV